MQCPNEVTIEMREEDLLQDMDGYDEDSYDEDSVDCPDDGSYGDTRQRYTIKNINTVSIGESKAIQPNWYKIQGMWHHCMSFDNGERYVDGIIQTENQSEVDESYNSGVGTENE